MESWIIEKIKELEESKQDSSQVPLFYEDFEIPNLIKDDEPKKESESERGVVIIDYF